MSDTFPSGSYFFIKSAKNGYVLDVYNGETTADTQLIIWPPKYDDCDNQLWRYEGGYLINKKSQMVIDVRGGNFKTNASIIQFYLKMTAAENQLWKYSDGFIHPQSQPELVLDIKGNTNKKGSNVILYNRKKDDNLNQKWNLEHYGPSDDSAEQARCGSPISYELAKDIHSHLYQEKGRKVHMSHELIAAAAAFEAVKAYGLHQENKGEKVSHGSRKQTVAGLAAAQIVKFAEEYNWNSSEQKEATQQAQAAAEQYCARVL